MSFSKNLKINSCVLKKLLYICLNGNGYIVVAEFKNLIMNIEREIKVRDAIKYCIENFDSQTATNRIVEFWKDELKLQEQQCNIANHVVINRLQKLQRFDLANYRNGEYGIDTEREENDNGDYIDAYEIGLLIKELTNGL
ncbi:MAG: hypothetical protein QXI16_03715 [Sulfolobaceae archaeon]